jgi:type I restriction enzyme R subunit
MLFCEKSGGKSLSQVVKDLLYAYNPDVIEIIEAKVNTELVDKAPADIRAAIQFETEKLQNEAAKVFTGELNLYIENVRKAHEQKIDLANPDDVLFAGWDTQNKHKAFELINDFTFWINHHKNEITALQIFYNQAYRRRDLTYKMIKELFDLLVQEKPGLSLNTLWDALALQEDDAMEGQLGKRMPRTEKPKHELVMLVSLIRKTIGIDQWLTAFDHTVDRNFQEWVFKKQAGNAPKFTAEQMQWLRMIKDYIASSFHVDKDDFDLNPFNAHGGLSKMWQLFGDKTDAILSELNDALAA